MSGTVIAHTSDLEECDRVRRIRECLTVLLPKGTAIREGDGIGIDEGGYFRCIGVEAY